MEEQDENDFFLDDAPEMLAGISHRANSLPPNPDGRFALLDRAMARTQYRRDALIDILHTAQEIFGYLSEEVLQYVAGSLKMPASKVYGVATFYNFFSLTPKGKHTVTICMGTACYVRGAANILAAISQELGIKAGETTADGAVSLDGARCIGACGMAPAVVIDGEINAQMTPEAAVSRVRALREAVAVGGG
jgi:bidirectional [NiFe] hydrogenase diaphorase subunit